MPHRDLLLAAYDVAGPHRLGAARRLVLLAAWPGVCKLHPKSGVAGGFRVCSRRAQAQQRYGAAVFDSGKLATRRPVAW